MNDAESIELWRAYRETRSEPAFHELVQRYINLVYSTALRRVGGDSHRAEDVAQMVFTDLARKATGLPESLMLGGWLHRHTCFVASTLMRSELRRQNREQEAAQMNAAAAEPNWKELCPILDEAINELEPTDRDAIILRYFEQLEHRSIARVFGVSEDAAQKRVSRAVGKLRELLEQRGVALAAAALGTVLSEQCIRAARVTLASHVASKAFAAAGTSAGVAALVARWMSPAGVKLVGLLLTGGIIVTGALWWRHGQEQRAHYRASAAAPGVAEPKSLEQAAIPSSELAPPAMLSTAAGKAVESSNTIRLTLMSADTSKPVPNVLIDYRGWVERKFIGKRLYTSRAGICEVPVPTNITSLELTTRSDGFADTRLSWEPGRGHILPAEYTLRLARPVPIGGRVVDADGKPVAGAKVGFNHEQDPNNRTWPENHEFSWIEVETGEDGRWEINRMAGEMIRRIYGSAKHPEHVLSEFVFVSRDSQTEAELRNKNYVFHLGRPLEITGTVLDAAQQPVARAKILVGSRSESGRRETVALEDGTFLVRGCKPGKNMVTADAKGFAATTIWAEVTSNSAPLRIVLQPGKYLLLRVVNTLGEPVPKASAWLNTFRSGPIIPGDTAPPPVQADFNPESDAEGRVFWDSAPDQELAFDVYAKGYMRVHAIKVTPDGKEHTITLPPALIISGTVKNEAGQPIPRFRIRTGWVDSTGIPQWSDIDRFSMDFAGGKFRHVFEEPVIVGGKDPGYIFKFEAEGYAPFISRAVDSKEGEVRLDITLAMAASTLLTVLSPEGRPVPEADVAVLSPGGFLKLGSGSFPGSGNNGALVYHSDSKGQAKILPDKAATRVMVAHASGYAETAAQGLPQEMSITLKPWGSIEGTFERGGKRMAGQGFQLQLSKVNYRDFALDEESFRTKTDAQGHFLFLKVAPGKYNIFRLVPAPGSDGMLSAYAPMKEVEIKESERATVTLGASGHFVSMRLRWPNGKTRQPGSTITALLRPAEAPDNVEDIFRRTFYMVESAEGRWEADDVPSGSFVLEAIALATDQAQLTAKSPIAIPVEPGRSVDIGEIGLAE